MSSTILACLALLQLAGGPEASQIHWQRSLDDALAIARAERRPLLVAVNMDGESASERIVRELYKDPAFVERTRGYVCLMSSVFRHTPRDHDDAGRRIECPRLGEVTCGEHVALEPILYDRFLGGDRIAPRHAVVTPEGEVVFDLTLLFDIEDVVVALDEVAARVPPVDEGARSDAWRRRSHRRRLEFERLGFLQTELEQDMWMQRLGTPRAPYLTPADAGAVLERPEENAVTVETLRALLPVQVGRAADTWVEAARRPENVAGAAAFLREQLLAFGDRLERPELDAHAGALVLLGRVDASPAGATLLRSYVALPCDPRDRQVAERGLEAVSTPAAAGGVSYALDEVERAFVLPSAAALATPVEPATAPADELPDEAALSAELADVEALLGDAPDDPALLLRMGRATLGLARRRMERGGGAEIGLLLEDALAYLERAREAYPRDIALRLDQARAAYSLSRFEEELEHGLDAWGLATGYARIPCEPAGADGVAELSAEAVEALRWIGDAAGRLLETVSGGDPERELWTLSVGGRAHLAVALSSYADGNDWVSLASYFAALGRWREEAWLAYEGLLRFPDHNGLHQALSRALHAAGRPDLAAFAADRVSWERPSSATALWYAGLAHFLHADWLRRGEQPARAIAVYARASAAFGTSKELWPGFADSVDHYVASASLGRGFASLLMDRQDEAARALVAGLAMRPRLATQRDGLDREPIDLLDAALEWRRGRPSPVDALALERELAPHDPGGAFWARAVSDTMLRESLRAEGRGDLELFERYLPPSIEAGRRAVASADEAENRRALAQGLTILGRWRLANGAPDEARALLAEAAPLQDLAPPAEGASEAELEALGAELRERLGERRPVDRPGR